MTFEAERGYRIVSANEMDAVYLIKAIAGILPHHPQSGQICFKNSDIYGCKEPELKSIKREMVYVFREGTLIANLTVRENLLLPIQHLYPHDVSDDIIERAVEYLANFRLNNILDQRPAELSYAAKKKLSYVRAALLEPRVVLLDKPMFNLEIDDREPVLDFLNYLRGQGVTLIMVSQFPGLLAELIDETIMLDQLMGSGEKEQV